MSQPSRKHAVCLLAALVAATALGAGASIVLLPGAVAAGQGGGSGRLFERVDQNRDGTVTEDEFTAAQDRMFGQLDADGSGAVSRDEFMQFRPRGNKAQARDLPEDRRARLAQFRERRFQGLDRNGDGSVDRAEFLAGGNDLFVRLDADGDGRVTLEEARRRQRQR
ncbi:MAG: EF-hand domain-containing protein [Alphaproteobacteria bacterium]|nr:EF-hand domain-containing protein [Alphaproteobacteria bacterium]